MNMKRERKKERYIFREKESDIERNEINIY